MAAYAEKMHITSTKDLFITIVDRIISELSESATEMQKLSRTLPKSSALWGKMLLRLLGETSLLNLSAIRINSPFRQCDCAFVAVYM